MATKYFKKENVRTEVRDGSNRLIKFIPVFGGDGVLALDEVNDKDAITALERLIERRIGGVYRISAEIFESLKKNEASTPSPKRSLLNEIRASPSHLSAGLHLAATPAVAASKITVMDEPPPPASVGKFQPRSRPLNPK